MKVVAIVQARLGSTRLPGKVLLPLRGAPLLARVLERVSAARTLDAVVVAATDAPADAAIATLSERLGMPCFRGHPTDLLDRHVQAARQARADVVVKIPSDCPLIDPAVIDRVVGRFRAAPERWDYVSNLHPQSYPDGNDVEVVPMPVLELAHREATRPHEREHTTPFIWDRPERFRLENVLWETGRDLSRSCRLTIDYQADYELIRAVYDALHREAGPPFSLAEILAFLDAHPEIAQLNAHLRGVNWYRHHLDELRTVSRRDTVVFEDA